ncbi:ABC transporter permease [Caulobacter sp. SLTY]|uniref:ABC transporter permease n=1 Tax=Caulobacter sp. SLTY TaxID=2683262 RepID=UPI00196AB7BC|nr:ABC transporter permease [Caulobacter sp. SLTY]
MRRIIELIAPLALVAVLLAGWEIACRVMEVPVYLLPAPSAVWTSLIADWAALAHAAWTTLSMALNALAIASLCACALALVGGLSPFVEKAIQPVAVTIQVTPVIAIAPLVMIWTGLDHPERAIIVLATIVAFFPIYSGAATGLRAADPDLQRLFALYGASRWQTLTRLRLPSAVPALVEGHKVATALAVIGAVVAEFVAGSGGAQGLAWRIIESANRLQTARVFAALVTLAVMAALLYALVDILERRILAWWRGR